MDQLDIPTHYPQINETANLFLQNFGPKFTKTRKGHIETDIVGAAGVSGLVLMRATVPELDELEPGIFVLSEIHDRENHLRGFMYNVINSMGLEAKEGWATPIPDEHMPILSMLEMTKRLENPLYDSCIASGIPEDFYSHVAALTAMKLVAAGVDTNRLPLDFGKALAFYGLGTGCRTAPYPQSARSKAAGTNILQKWLAALGRVFGDVLHFPA